MKRICARRRKAKRRRHLRRARDTEKPERRCIATGASGDSDRLVRFVRDPQGRVVPDLAGKLPGRGAWVTASREALAMAKNKGLFSRAFRALSECPDDLASRVQEGLQARLVSALGLARRAGAVVTGYEKSRAAIAGGRAFLLIVAADASRGVSRKMLGSGRELPIVQLLSADHLAGALGVAGATYAAVTAQGEAARILKEARRFESFQGGSCGLIEPCAEMGDGTRLNTVA